MSSEKGRNLLSYGETKSLIRYKFVALIAMAAAIAEEQDCMEELVHMLDEPLLECLTSTVYSLAFLEKDKSISARQYAAAMHYVSHSFHHSISLDTTDAKEHKHGHNSDKEATDGGLDVHLEQGSQDDASQQLEPTDGAPENREEGIRTSICRLSETDLDSDHEFDHDDEVNVGGQGEVDFGANVNINVTSNGNYQVVLEEEGDCCCPSTMMNVKELDVRSINEPQIREFIDKICSLVLQHAISIRTAVSPCSFSLRI